MMTPDTIPRIEEEGKEPTPRTSTKDATVTAEAGANKSNGQADSDLESGQKRKSTPARAYSKPMQQGIGERAIGYVLEMCFFDKEGIDYLI